MTGGSLDTPDTPDPSGPLDTPGSSAAAQVRRGTLQGAAAYALWGLFPFYFYALLPAGPVEVIGHRILWSMLTCLVLLVLRGQWVWLRTLTPALVGRLTVAALVVAVNWFTYVVAVQAGQTNEAALGYFLNPLLTVTLGVLVLGERLRRLQAAAVLVGALAAAYLTVVGGRVPVIALIVSTSFALYGLLKNRVGRSLDALSGFAVETAALSPIAALLLGLLSLAPAALPSWLHGGEPLTFTTLGAGHAALLVLAGPVTTVPLLLFAAAARRVPLVTIGLLQFLAPVLQLASGLALGEHVSPARWAGFAIVWVALALLTVDSFRQRLPGHG